MNGKQIWLAALVVGLLGQQAARAQAPAYGSGVVGSQPPSPVAEAETPFIDFGARGAPGYGTGPKQPLWGPTDWLNYPRSPGCCGPVGLDGPINTEVFFRSGIIWPIGGGELVNRLNEGWEAELGGRALFFNPSLDRAWTVGLSVSNIYNKSSSNQVPITLTNIPVRTSAAALQQAAAQQAAASGNTAAAQQLAAQASQLSSSSNTTPVTVVVPSVDVTIRSLNQTFVNLFGGREWYLIGSGNCSDGPNWRAGVDVGGSWGTADMELNEIRHRTHVDGGVFVAAHSDIEIPFHCTFLSAGLRAQWGYIWTSLLQSNPADYQYFGLLATLGVRF